MAMICLSVIIGLLLTPPVAESAGTGKNIQTFIGPKDALLVTAEDDSVVLAVNETAPRIPASILKIFTSLVALHYLGPAYRFPTDFFLDEHRNLKIKGYGDPLFISEIIDDISRNLTGTLTTINDIVLDDSYFTQPVFIPGRSATRNPYDAPNGALCANFNTVKFKKDRTGRFVSAEPQTPLVPFVLPKIRAAGVKTGRIVLSHHHRENVLYVGHLFLHFLKQYGVRCRGAVRTGKIDTGTDRRLRRYLSPYTLEDIIKRLLEHSNNYMANQLLIAVGARTEGPPGTLSKGIDAARAYAKDILETDNIRLVEGSGIARKNRISARDMIRVLVAFEPFRHLMTHRDRIYFKTGTLNGIQTRAGYIESATGTWYRFAVMINTPGKSADKVVHRLLSDLR